MKLLRACLRQGGRWAVHLLCVLFASASPGVSEASAIDELARVSPIVIAGQVETLRAQMTGEVAIASSIEVRVEAILKGELDEARLTIEEEGGRVGTIHHVVYGAPTFEVGEHVLLFLVPKPDGTFQVDRRARGKFRLVVGESGALEAIPDRGVGLTSRAWGEDPDRAPIPFSEIRAVIQAGDRSWPIATASVLRRELTEPVPVAGSQEERDVVFGVELIGGRVFEADEGRTVPFLLDLTDSFLDPEEGRAVFRAAMAAWGDVPTASLTLGDAKEDAASARFHVIFQPNPFAQPGDVRSCGTIGGVASSWLDSSERKVVNGKTFIRTVNATAVVYTREGENGCDIWTPCNVAEVMTHEIGHTIGLGHSKGLESRGATMSGAPHHDCRCAGVRSPDAKALSFVYPTEIPPTIMTPAQLPDGVLGKPYHVELEAIGGAGEYAWSFTTDGTNPDVRSLPGMELSSEGMISGVPTVSWMQLPVFIKAEDTYGDSHVKRFNLFIHAPGVPTTVASTTTTTVPTAMHTDFACVPVTTTTTLALRLPCFGRVGFFGVQCELVHLEILGPALSRPKLVMRMHRRMLHRMATARRYELQGSRLKKAAVLLRKLNRQARTLGRLAGKQSFRRREGAQAADRMSEIAQGLVATTAEYRVALQQLHD